MGTLPQRKQIRLALDHYRDPNAIASLTITVRDRRPIFRDERFARLMVGVIEVAAHDTATPVYAYAVMPDHVHLLIGAGIKPAPTMLRGNVGADFTSARSVRVESVGADFASARSTLSMIQFIKLVKGRSVAVARRDGLVTASFWQRSFFDHFLRREETIETVVRYILENPVRASLAQSWDEWVWSGSLVYSREDLAAIMGGSGNGRV